MIKTLVVEDESKSRSMLLTMIQKVNPNLQIVGEANNVKDGVEKIKTLKPDLVFLDVSMPDGTGFDLLEQVQGQKFDLIFATASDQHAIKAIKYSACDYLLKPIDIDELKIAIDKVLEKKSGSPNMDNLNFLIQQLKKADDNFQKITLPTGNAYEIVAIKDIIRCEADASYTTFYLLDKRKIMVSFGLKHYEELLPSNEFIRVHHQHLINMNHVVRYLKEDGGYAVMVDGSKIELSRRKKDHFLEKLGNK
ncbi:MAG: LytR/AlgR family response regulator transcription factor [Bacteroidota bacterium]|jgi:two-component system LytT family response regulator|nr:response regulator transcription factor [Bacteroidota bacterium]MCA6444484.1 response regulator transcription factor [Bacteroidota bacterium]